MTSAPETASRPRRRARLATLSLAATLALAGTAVLATPRTATASPTDELQEAQRKVQESNEAYSEATARVEELNGEIAENEERIDEIEQELPGKQERATDSIRLLYKMQQGSGNLLSLLLSADDFYDLLSTIQYLDVIQSHNADAVNELVALVDELSRTRAELELQRDEAEAEQERAADALAEAKAARSRLEAQIAAQAAAEEAERRAAIEVARKAQQAAAESAGSSSGSSGSVSTDGSGNATFETESGNQAVVEVPSTPDPGPVDWDNERDAFVAEWTARIDAYLAGSPLAGQGATFASAAWDYGCDPRFSPAIAMVESSLGRHCVLPHNAWGWGSASWGSWEEAIRAHVAGLAAGYGGQLTYAGAQKYCPPNADKWYTSVLANMERI